MDTLEPYFRVESSVTPGEGSRGERAREREREIPKAGREGSPSGSLHRPSGYPASLNSGHNSIQLLQCAAAGDR